MWCWLILTRRTLFWGCEFSSKTRRNATVTLVALWCKSFLPSNPWTILIIPVAKAVRKENCRIGKDKVNVLTVFHSTTNIPCWDFHRGIGVIIIESVSMKSFVFIHPGHRRFSLCASRQSLGQLLVLVCDTDWLLPEPCYAAKNRSRWWQEHNAAKLLHFAWFIVIPRLSSQPLRTP